MDSQMPQGYVCWSADGMEMIKSNVGDLGIDDNPILAALHEPMSLRARIPGSPTKYYGQDFGSADSESDDVRILHGLNSTLGDSSQMASNLLIAVKGDTGSGKSHFVRWLYQNVRQIENAKYVWVIRRADSKMQVIRKFVEDLALLGSAKADELRVLIDRSFADISEDREKLTHQLYWELTTELMDTELLIEGKTNSGIRSIIVGKNTESRNYLHNLLLRYIDDELQGRIEGGFISVLREVVENFEVENPKSEAHTKTRVVGFSETVTRNILRKYERFAEPSFSDLLTTSQSNCSIVTEILNESLDVAIAKVMHVDGSGFKEIFGELRQEMARLGQQLVIFMEDFSGVASSQNGLNKLQADLLEVFTESASKERAPLRVIYAITDNTFQILPSNVLERHSLVIDINNAFNSTNATSFVSRYLNISRSDQDSVRHSYATASLEDRINTAWVPNACDSCNYMSQCHDTFGKTSNGVGLYPLNSNAAKKIFEKNPTEPRHIVGRTLDLLHSAQSSIPNFTFPTEGNLASNLLSDDFDRAEMLERRFVRSAEDGVESERKMRYLHVWGNGEPPSTEESRIFNFKDLGDLVRDSSGGKVTTPLTPKKDLPPRDLQEFDRIQLWRSSKNSIDAVNSLTNTLYTRLRASIKKAIEENFEANYGKIIVYRDMGLRFTEQSVTVSGFSENEDSNLFLPTYSIPRSDFGKSVLVGAYLRDQLRNSTNFGISTEEISQAYACFGKFIMEAVEDLVERIKLIESSENGPLGVAARIIKFQYFVVHEIGEPKSDEIIDWLGTEGSLNLVDEDSCDRITSLSRGLTDLKKVVRTFIDIDGLYQFKRMIEAVEGGPIEILSSLIQPISDISSLSEPRRPNWYRQLESDLRMKIVEILSPEFELQTRAATISNYEFCSKQLSDEFEFTREELIELANKVINQANNTIAREKFLDAIEKFFGLVELWITQSEKIKELSDTESDFDEFLKNYRLVEKFNNLSNFLSMLRSEFIKADAFLRSSMDSGLGVVPIVPINLEELTTVAGFEQYVID